MKSYPWFVSDVTKNDVSFTLGWMASAADEMDNDEKSNYEDVEESNDKELREDYQLDHNVQNKSVSVPILSLFSSRWKKRFSISTWSIREHPFWTLPAAFRGLSESDGARFPAEGMITAAPDLYATLASSDLALFKGDLNYRKLMGDLDWESTTSFGEALGDFRPTKIAALRTLKANVVTGLKRGVKEKLDAEGKDWMTNGRYAVIQLG